MYQAKPMPLKTKLLHSAHIRFRAGIRKRQMISAKRYTEAIIECRECIRLDPQAADSHEYLGIALCRTGALEDSGLYDDPAHLDWSFPQTMATQQQRARQSAQILAEFYNMPFVIGAHWFSWGDFDSPQRHANRGLFKVNNQPWPELQAALKDLTASMGEPAKGKDLPRPAR